MKFLLLPLLFIGTVSIAACAASLPEAPSIESFQECVDAGYPVLRSLPPKCMTPAGEMFVDISDTSLCVDSCGDGICQEMVCLGEGCPCAESAESCPEDCAPGEAQ